MVDVQPPIIVAERESGMVADAKGVEFSVCTPGPEGVVDVRIPGTVWSGGWAMEHLSIAAGLGQQAGRPDVAIAESNRQGPGILMVFLGVQDCRNTELAQVVDAGNLFGLTLGLGQGGEEHRRQDRDDRDHDEEFN